MKCFVMIINVVEDEKQAVMLRLHTDEYERAVTAGFVVDKPFYDYLLNIGVIKQLHLMYIYELPEEMAINCFREFRRLSENISKRKILCENKGCNKILMLDIETSRINDNNEIIKLTIKDSKGKVVFDSLFKPYSNQISEKATEIHGITINDVWHDTMLHHSIFAILEILLDADLVLAYDIDCTLQILKQSIAAAFHNKRISNDKYMNIIMSINKIK